MASETFSRKELYTYYKSCDELDVFNESAKEDNYWIDAADELDISMMKVSWDPLLKKGDYTIPWFEPPFLVIPQLMFDKFLGLSFRSYNGSGDYNQNFIDGFYCYTASASKEKKPSFSKNDPVVLSEGPMDAEALSLFYDFSFSSLGAFPGQLFLKSLETITSKLLYVPDNDDAGDKTAGRLVNMAKYNDLDMYVEILNLPDAIEDAGDFLKNDLLDSKLFERVKSRMTSKIHKLKRVSV